MRLLRWFCFYCFSRFLYDSVRRAAQRPVQERKPCDHRFLRMAGFLLVLTFLAPLIVGAVFAYLR
jgi:hypothetical protein